VNAFITGLLLVPTETDLAVPARVRLAPEGWVPGRSKFAVSGRRALSSLVVSGAGALTHDPGGNN